MLQTLLRSKSHSPLEAERHSAFASATSTGTGPVISPASFKAGGHGEAMARERGQTRVWRRLSNRGIFLLMPRRLRAGYPGAIYLVMSRANGKGSIFETDVDRRAEAGDCGGQGRRHYPREARTPGLERGPTVPTSQKRPRQAGHGGAVAPCNDAVAAAWIAARLHTGTWESLSATLYRRRRANETTKRQSRLRFDPFPRRGGGARDVCGKRRSRVLARLLSGRAATRPMEPRPSSFQIAPVTPPSPRGRGPG